jgi:hypothetical protein
LGAIAMGLLSDMDDMIDRTDIVLPGACLKVNERLQREDTNLARRIVDADDSAS